MLGSRTLVQDEDSDEHEDCASLSIAMERLLKMTRLASSGSGMPSMGSSPPLSGFGSSRSSGPSPPGPLSPGWSIERCWSAQGRSSLRNGEGEL